MRRIHVVALFLLTSLVLATGSADAHRLRLGLKGGASFSNFVGDGTDAFTVYAFGQPDPVVRQVLSDSRRTGIGTAVFLTIPVNQYLSLQPELCYMQKGDRSSNPLDVTLKLDYLEIPVFLKMHLPVSSGDVFFMLGPAVDINLSGTFDLDGRGFTAVEDGPVFLLRDITWAAVFGGGYEFDFGPGRGVLEVRYSFGLSDIGDKENWETLDPYPPASTFVSYDVTAVQRTAMLLIGYQFEL